MDLIIYKLISNIGLKITLWYKITSRTDLSYESKIKYIFEKSSNRIIICLSFLIYTLNFKSLCDKNPYEESASLTALIIAFSIT
nr:hypothetical protein CPBEC4_19270 [Clostridium perfringens]